MSEHSRPEEWFEDIEIEGHRLSHVSKFWRPGFTISPQSVADRWSSWDFEEKDWFAFAFSKRQELNDQDEEVLTYIIVNGEPRIWRNIALLTTRSRDRRQAVDFLLARVKEGNAPLANYYQALEKLREPDTVPVLKEAFVKHTQKVQAALPLLSSVIYKPIFLDYLSCCAALFLTTEEEGYRDVLRDMSRHQDTVVSKLAHMVATQSGIDLTFLSEQRGL